MVSTFFQSEVSALEAQVVAAQQRIVLLNEAEFVAGGSLEALKGAIEKVTALAPSALATLRTAVLDLFRGDSNDGGNGNQPSAPQPDAAHLELIEENIEATSIEDRPRSRGSRRIGFQIGQGSTVRSAHVPSGRSRRGNFRGVAG